MSPPRPPEMAMARAGLDMVTRDLGRLESALRGVVGVITGNTAPPEDRLGPGGGDGPPPKRSEH